jgi:type I site-specific restriction endonuclease
MATEADTCRTLIIPRLQSAGWENDPHSDYTRKVRTLCAGPEEQAMPAPNGGRAQAPERGIDFATVAAQAGQPDADPFDLPCHLAFNAPILTRRQRADRVKNKQAAMFNYLRPEAQEILNQLLEKYAADGELHFLLPDDHRAPRPASRHDLKEAEGYRSESPRWLIHTAWSRFLSLVPCIQCAQMRSTSTHSLRNQ